MPEEVRGLEQGNVPSGPSVQVRELRILNRLGIHARPAALFAKTASRFGADIRVQKDGLDVNGKSIMGIMMLAGAQGNVIRVLAQGEDADEALAAIEEIVSSKFGEE